MNQKAKKNIIKQIKPCTVKKKIDVKESFNKKYANINKIMAIFIMFFIILSCLNKVNAVNMVSNLNTLKIEKIMLANNEKSQVNEKNNEENNILNAKIEDNEESLDEEDEAFNAIIEDDEEDEALDIGKIQNEVIQTSSNTEGLDVDSRIALIYDRASGRILYEKNRNKQTPMASTTKILTAIVVLENANLKDIVTIDSKAASIGGSRLGLKKNDKITVNDLLYGLMLRSGNDAAVALATYVGGSIEGFAEMMNNKAKEMGLVNSHFVVPHGLDTEGHYTTAYELAKMADYALKIDKFRQIVSTKTTTIYINGYAKAINNTNQLLGSISGVYGVKTGFTNGAGRCLVTACKRDDLDIITVIIGADTTKQRTADTIKLINYAYQNFEIINIKEIVENKFREWQEINQGRIYVNKGIENEVKLYLEDLAYEAMAIRKDKKDKIDIEVNSVFYLEAPVERGKIIANLKIKLDEEVIEILNIYNEREIRKKGVEDYLIEFIECIIKVSIIW